MGIDAQRCLPAQGTATKAQVHSKTLQATYGEEELHGHKQGTISEPDFADPDLGMQKIIESAMDPVMEDTMLWKWVKAPEQWKKTCLKEIQVPFVRSHKRTKRIRTGTSLQARYQTKRWTTYSQEYSPSCTAWRWDRTCPQAGEGLFIKEIPAGTCMKEPFGLADEGNSATLALNEL